MEDFTTIIWVVIIIGAMIFNTLSKARKAQNKDGQAPSQHGEAWPSIPWDDAQNRETPSPNPTAQRPVVDPGSAAEHRDRGPIPAAAASTPNSRNGQDGKADETGRRSGSRVDETARKSGSRVDETARRSGGRVDETARRSDSRVDKTGWRSGGRVVETDRRVAGTDERPIDTGVNPAGTGRRWVSSPDGSSWTTDQGAMGVPMPERRIAVPQRRDLSTWDESLKKPHKRWESSVSEDFPDECQSLEEISDEVYLAGFDDMDEEVQAGSFGEQKAVGNPLKSSGSIRKNGQNTPSNAPSNSNQAQARILGKEKSTDEIVKEFDLRQAVIYSEILKPKFEE